MSIDNFEMTTLREFIVEWHKGCGNTQTLQIQLGRPVPPSACEACTDAFMDAVVRLVSPKGKRLKGLKLYDALLRQCLAEKLGFAESLALAHQFVNRKPLANEES